MSKTLVSKALDNPVQLALGACLVIGVVYWIGRKTLTDAASATAGLVTGNNAITAGTAYEGKGIAGTVGGAVDKAGGGLFSTIGGWLGGKIYEVSHPEWNGGGLVQDQQRLREGAAYTNNLWGPIGGVELRQ